MKAVLHLDQDPNNNDASNVRVVDVGESRATAETNRDAFHAHLDVCSQCENSPFDLCPVGTHLIQQAVSNAIALKINELTAYQASVFLILNDGRAGKRFRDEAALSLIAKHSALITDRERRRFEPLASARAIVEAEADSVCEDIDSVINWLHLSRYERALIFAVRAHGEQKRRYTGEPFIVHPIAVAGILAEAGLGEDIIIAGLLHDVAEDTNTGVPEIEAEFGPRVARVVGKVMAVSTPADGDRSKRKAREREYLALACDGAQNVKVADMINNVPSICAHDPEFARIYLAEKSEMLAVLTRADHNLLRRAYEVLEAGKRNLHLSLDSQSPYPLESRQ